jgi:ribosomal protein L20A (L18A)
MENDADQLLNETLLFYSDMQKEVRKKLEKYAITAIYKSVGARYALSEVTPQ